MPHILRIGDRVRFVGEFYSPAPNRPVDGDVGTIVTTAGDCIRAVFDRAETHCQVGPDSSMFNGKQSWGSPCRSYRYIGRRVNPDKV